jgi:protocatechuate 3,4-dioxygenase beta subunit
MGSDDKQIGELVTRREAIILLGLAGVSVAAGCSRSETANAADASTTKASLASGPGCVVRPEQTAGPYYVDEKLHRSDIRSDPSDGSVKDGTPLELTFKLSQLKASSCAPIAGAVVDVWHCDAQGVYSDVRDMNGFFDTKGKKFLRGYQLTDASGRATFKTIYPGWYQGRTVHIHFTIRTNPSASSAHEFTSQIYFDDSVNDKVLAQAPYSKPGQRMRNEQDGIFRDNGSQLILALRPSNAGYAGIFDIALKTS